MQFFITTQVSLSFIHNTRGREKDTLLAQLQSLLPFIHRSGSNIEYTPTREKLYSSCQRIIDTRFNATT